MGHDEAWRWHQIVVAGVQTIGTSIGARRLQRFKPDEFDAIVCDEAHHAIAATYRTIFEHFGLFEADSNKLLLGVTATPVRGDGRGLNAVFQEIVYQMSILDAIQKGWLCDLRAYRIRTTVDLDRVRANPGGDFVEDQLGLAVNTSRRNNEIVGTWLKLGGQRRTVVFCVTIQHAKDLAEAFKAQGVAADCIWGEDQDRGKKLDKHKRGEITVLTNCAVLTEGYDDWQISCILLARPTRSELLFTQMIGRGTRIEEGLDNLVDARIRNQDIRKPDCIVIDVVDNSTIHRLVTMATLFGYETDHDFEGACVSRVGRKIQQMGPTEPRLVPDRMLDEMAALVEEVDLFAPKWSDGILNRSVLQWFRRGNSFLLPLPNGENIAVEHDGAWSANGIINGHQFRSATFGSFGDALAQGEKMLKILGAAILEKIRVEEHAASDSITPTQEQLLRSANNTAWKPNLTRDQAALRIARAYEHKLNARCVSELPSDVEDDALQGNDASSDFPQAEEQTIEAEVLPAPWNQSTTMDSVLRWYRTDDDGYAMPLPESGEICLLPRGARWRISGEICGVGIAEQFHESLEAAFVHAQNEMEEAGAKILCAVRAERAWVDQGPTPLERALLGNLLGAIEAQSIDDRAAARRLIESLYKYEYNPGGVQMKEVKDHAGELITKYGLDIEAIHESVQDPE